MKSHGMQVFQSEDLHAVIGIAEGRHLIDESMKKFRRENPPAGQPRAVLWYDADDLPTLAVWVDPARRQIIFCSHSEAAFRLQEWEQEPALN